MQFPFKPIENREFDVVGFGTNAVDYLIQVPHYPEFNSKVELTGYVQAAGGEVATTMAGLQRLGLKTSYIGRFGSDAAGDLGWKTLADEGVDLTWAERVEGARTQIAFIVIDVRNGERTVIWQRDQKLAFSEEEAPVESAECAQVLHFTPHDARACLRMAKRAREAGTIVSIDIDNIFDGVDELLHYVDILITSAEFPGRLLGIYDSREALKEFTARYGCAVAGITLGEAGSLLLCEGSFIETQGFAVPGGCKDTTGAGDSFRVGLLYGLLKGESIEESARMANAVAALKCRAIGARTSLPTVDELDDLLSKEGLL
jgi:sugar/nucleoside kinase (ribokinase family)